MSKKITESMLKGLVERVLSEKDLPIDVDYTTKGKIKGKKDLKKDLGLSHHTPDYEKLKKLASIDKEQDNLTKKDFKDAYSTGKGTHAVDSAEEIRTNTKDSTLKSTIDNIYNGSDRQKAVDKAIADKAAKAARTAALKDSETKADIAAILKSLKGISTVEKRLKAFIGDYLDPNGKMRTVRHLKITKASDAIFQASFDEGEMLRIASYQHPKVSKPELKIPDSADAVKKLLKAAVDNRIQKENDGTIDQNGYTRFVTPEVKGSSALKYLYKTKKDGVTITSTNYNYTVFSKNPIEPWFIADKSDNFSAIETLMNSNKQSDKNYLNKFLRKSTSTEKEDKIFLHNLKVFKVAIEQKGIKTKNNAWWKAMVQGYLDLTSQDPEVTPDLKRTSLTSPAIMSQAAGSGQMLSSQFSMFNTFFEGTPPGSSALDTMTKRVKKLTDFAQELYDVEDTPTVSEVVGKTNFSLDSAGGLVKLRETSNKYIDLLNKIMMLDYFNTMAKELDSGAGAYVFEAFCAYLAGGRVAGKEKGLKGGMGETDFFFDNGERGSAKYLAKTSSFSQSVGNFLQGVKVTYVFASKRGHKPVYEKTTGELIGFDKTKKIVQTDPDLIHYIDLYVVEVERVDQSEIDDEVPFKIRATDQTDQSIDLAIIQNNVTFDVSKFKPAGRLHLVDKDYDSIMTKLDALAKKMDIDQAAAKTSFETLVKNFTNTFKHLESAKEKVSEYSNTGTKDLGDKALIDMSDAQTEFAGVMSLIEPEESKLRSESKKVTSNLLNKLIEENFKK